MLSKKRTGRKQVTLARVLSKFGIASRSESQRLILAGKVSVNGRMVRTPDRWVDPQADHVALNGDLIRRQIQVYFAMHKPCGVVTTRSDERGRATVFDLLPEKRKWMFPIGRLDKESSGLLLFTNDTRFGDRVTNPIEKIPKTYVVELDRPLKEADARIMESGMKLEDGSSCRSVMVRIPDTGGTHFEMTLHEGKNRQIRRMCKVLGYSITGLLRTRIGPVELGSLPEGKIRPLTTAERAFLSSTHDPSA
jgi:23S rRNA pseudouridine2605 synthase